MYELYGCSGPWITETHGPQHMCSSYSLLDPAVPQPFLAESASMYCSCSILNLILFIRGVWNTAIIIYKEFLYAPVFMSGDADA